MKKITLQELISEWSWETQHCLHEYKCSHAEYAMYGDFQDDF